MKTARHTPLDWPERTSITLRNEGTRICVGTEDALWPVVKVLRRSVFFEEEGFGPDMIETPLDPYGVHLVVWQDLQAAAAVTVVPPEPASELARQVCLPEVLIGKAAFVTKMVVLPTFRQHGLPRLMVACMERYIFERQRYRYAFVVLMGSHVQHEPLYQHLVGFQRVAEGQGAYGQQIVMAVDRKEQAFREIRQTMLIGQLDAFIRESWR